MNRRVSYLSFVVVLAGTGALLATTAQSQLGQPKAYVSLQPTTPGTSQSGHSNVSGTSRAGQFVGGGAGLTNVNATQLGGLAPSAFGQLSSANMWTAANTFNNASGIAVYADGLTRGIVGIASFGYGVEGFGSLRGGSFTNTDFGGTGVFAIGSTYGVEAQSDYIGVKGTAVFYGSEFEGTSVNGIGVIGKASNTSGNTFGGKFDAVSPGGIGVYATGGWGVRGIGFTDGGVFDGLNSGITATGVNRGVVASAEANGGFFTASNANGWGLTAYAPFRGVHGESSGSQGIGVNGLASGVGGLSYGGHFVSESSSGTGVYGSAGAYGGWLESYSSSGTGVLGYARATSGTTYGGKFLNDSPQGYAGHFTGIGPEVLYVQNTGTGRGIFISTNSDTAVWANTTSGFASVDARNASTNGFGVFGYATSNSGSSIGVAGQSNSPSGWGLFSYGNSGATGVKSFRIDHPLDPENRYLLHYSTEMPEPQNAYNGTVVTDAKGEAWVKLPDYFEQINKSFKYQLTVVDDTDSDQFVIAKVAKKIRNNQFKIRTNAPNIEVAWEVKTIRNDLWMQKYGAPSEVAKSDAEKGTYQHPELYGQPAERGMNFRQKQRTAEPFKPFPNSLKPMRK